MVSAKVVFKLRLKEARRETCEYLRYTFSKRHQRGHSPEVGVCVACWRKSQEARVAGADWGTGWGGGKADQVHRACGSWWVMAQQESLTD